MGNCQAIDNATLLVQHPSGRVDKLYWPVSASEIMKMNPGHYVALLLTTTYCPPAKTTTTNGSNNNNNNNNTEAVKNNVPVRITRIKLLRPTDTLGLGHVYRLVTTQEVMKGLCAKKYAKLKMQHPELADKQDLKNSDFQQVGRRSLDNTNMVKHDRHRRRIAPSANPASTKSRAWQPKLQSISETAS